MQKPTFKAAVCTRYGPPEVVKIQQRPKPTPKDNEMLVRVRATTVSSGDTRVRSANVPALYKPLLLLSFGLRRPRQPVLGTELSGEVEAVGKKLTGVKAGNAIFAMTGLKMGAHAEYVVLPGDAHFAPKPDNLSHEQAAALSFGGTSALYFLRKGKLQKGQKVLIYGASGSVGTSAVQLAKHFGAEVTAICSDENAQLVKSLGADTVMDYAVEDFRHQPTQYDIVFDAVGKLTQPSCAHNLGVRGSFVTVSKGFAREHLEDIHLLGQLAQSGKFKPVIDRTYALESIVEAHAYVDIGHKTGNVVIQVA